MQEISLNILDIAQNSVKARATLITIIVDIDSSSGKMVCEIIDNGSGMTEEQVKNVTNPFYTTRTTRKVGLGVPFFKMTAEMTGGSFDIFSTPGAGTKVIARYNTGHIDMLPLGDIKATVISLVSVNPDIDFVYTSRYDGSEFTMDTREFKKVLDGVPINSPEVLNFIGEFITENQNSIINNH